MQKEVLVSTTLTTVTPEGEDRILTENKGRCTVGDRGILLHYHESENHGDTTWVLTPEVVDLRRQGLTTARFTFIEGRMTATPYKAPHGNLALDIFTHSAALTVDAQGIRFEARYTVLAQGQAVTDNTLRLEARFTEAPQPAD